jgi:hypothetical protein
MRVALPAFKGRLAVLSAPLLAACTALLPTAENITQGGWASFKDARDVIERIVPYTTRTADLLALGIDPYTNPAITILNYSDIMQRFATGSAVLREDMDRGILQCLGASKACQGYAINVKRINRDRTGSFWLDSFNFKREVDVTGWTFNAIIVIVDDLVVYTLYGGQPIVHEHETSRNPLGPLQGWGERVAPLVLP